MTFMGWIAIILMMVVLLRVLMIFLVSLFDAGLSINFSKVFSKIFNDRELQIVIGVSLFLVFIESLIQKNVF